jgi:hypothetical protein
MGSGGVFSGRDDDARTLAPYTKPHFEAYDLTHLEVHQAAVFARYNGNQQPAFSLQTRPVSKTLTASEPAKEV